MEQTSAAAAVVDGPSSIRDDGVVAESSSPLEHFKRIVKFCHENEVEQLAAALDNIRKQDEEEGAATASSEAESNGASAVLTRATLMAYCEYKATALDDDDDLRQILWKDRDGEEDPLTQPITYLLSEAVRSGSVEVAEFLVRQFVPTPPPPPSLACAAAATAVGEDTVQSPSPSSSAKRNDYRCDVLAMLIDAIRYRFVARRTAYIHLTTRCLPDDQYDVALAKYMAEWGAWDAIKTYEEDVRRRGEVAAVVASSGGTADSDSTSASAVARPAVARRRKNPLSFFPVRHLVEMLHALNCTGVISSLSGALAHFNKTGKAPSSTGATPDAPLTDDTASPAGGDATAASSLSTKSKKRDEKAAQKFATTQWTEGETRALDDASYTLYCVMRSFLLLSVRNALLKGSLPLLALIYEGFGVDITAWRGYAKFISPLISTFILDTPVLMGEVEEDAEGMNMNSVSLAEQQQAAPMGRETSSMMLYPANSSYMLSQQHSEMVADADPQEDEESSGQSPALRHALAILRYILTQSRAFLKQLDPCTYGEGSIMERSLRGCVAMETMRCLVDEFGFDVKSPIPAFGDYSTIIFAMMKRPSPRRQKTQMAIIRYLIEEKGVDEHHQGAGDTSPFLYAAAVSRLDVLKYLMFERGHDTQSGTTVHGWTALHRAVVASSLKVAEFLISHGADINAQTNDLAQGFTLTGASEVGETPLHTAVKSNRVNAVRLLLNAGCDYSLRDEDGNTAFECIPPLPDAASVGDHDHEGGEDGNLFGVDTTDEYSELRWLFRNDVSGQEEDDEEERRRRGLGRQPKPLTDWDRESGTHLF